MRSVLDINKEYSEKYFQKIGGGFLPQMINRLLDKGDIKQIVDLGCGDGGTILGILKKYKNKKIVGVDISPRRIKSLRKRLPKYNFICRDVCNTRLLKHFDLVICTQVIEHVENDKKLLKEIYRILKPLGYLYISSVIRKSWAIYKYRNRHKRFVLDPTHEYEYSSKKEFVNLLKNHKFKPLRLKVYSVKRKLFNFTILIPGFYIIEALCQK